MTPSLSVVQHLGLYATFHRSRGNRLLHALSLPIICFTAFMLVGRLSWAIALPISIVLTLARLDRAGALWLAAWLLPLFWAASALVREVALGPALLCAAVVHATAWFLAVDVGHRKIEPRIVINGESQDTNLYFREGYFVGRGLGRPTSGADGVIQFMISLLGFTHELLSAFGLRGALRQAVEDESERIRERVAHGLTPFAAE